MMVIKAYILSQGKISHTSLFLQRYFSVTVRLTRWVLIKKVTPVVANSTCIVLLINDTSKQNFPWLKSKVSKNNRHTIQIVRLYQNIDGCVKSSQTMTRDLWSQGLKTDGLGSEFEMSKQSEPKKETRMCRVYSYSTKGEGSSCWMTYLLERFVG